MSMYTDIQPTEETLERCKVEPSGGRGGTTGRTRWKVVCRFCDKVLHRGTTGPNSWECDCCDEARPKRFR
jgi:hypothetical protein